MGSCHLVSHIIVITVQRRTLVFQISIYVIIFGNMYVKFGDGGVSFKILYTARKITHFIGAVGAYNLLNTFLKKLCNILF